MGNLDQLYADVREIRADVKLIQQQLARLRGFVFGVAAAGGVTGSSLVTLLLQAFGVHP